LIGGDNYASEGYCLDKTKIGSQFWLRYASGTASPHTLANHDLTVTASCMPTANFQKLSTLKFTTEQATEANISISNQRDTVITNFKTLTGTFMNLVDESGVNKSYAPL
jgi:hypothetical protein